MNAESKERWLKLSLATFGAIFLLIYPLGLVWPAGWVWHGGEGSYYLQMIIGVYFVLGVYLIMASRNPSENKSLIGFTVWSSVVHALVMAYHGFADGNEFGHLIGDVPALLLVAAVLGYLSSGQKPGAAVSTA